MSQFPNARAETPYANDPLLETQVVPQQAAPPAPPTPPTSASSQGTSTADVAKEQGTELKDQAKQAGGQIAGTAKDEAAHVLSEAKDQTRDLLEQGQQELRTQAAQQQERLASGLRALADELHSMAQSSQQQGVASDLARQAADRAGSAARWLSDREPGVVVQEVRTFAQRRPGAFLGLALVSGVVVGRLGRGLKDGPVDDGSPAHHRVDDAQDRTADGAYGTYRAGEGPAV